MSLKNQQNISNCDDNGSPLEEEEYEEEWPVNNDLEKNKPTTSNEAVPASHDPQYTAGPVGLRPPPDGGFFAWTQVFLGHLVVTCTWGFVTSFGCFQTYYTESLGRPPSDISWIGSVQVFLLFFVGIFSGRTSDAGYFKTLMVVGSVLEVFSIMMASLSTEYYQLFLAQGVGQSVGAGLIFCPTTALVPTYFTNKTFALGCVAAGSATGGMIFPAVVLRLLPRVGYAWTMRTLGFIVLALLTPSVLFLRQRLPPRKAGPLVELSAFKEPPYLLFNVGMFLCICGVYVGYFYIGSFGRNVIGVSQTTSVYLLVVMNAVGLPMRLIPSLIANKFTGPLNLLIPSCLTTGIVAFGWSGVKSLGGLYAWTVIYGSVGAALQGLFPGTVSSLTLDLQKMGVRFGMVFACMGVAALIGSPISGALVSTDHGQYLYAQMFMSTLLTAGSFILVGCRYARVGLRWERV